MTFNDFSTLHICKKICAPRKSLSCVSSLFHQNFRTWKFQEPTIKYESTSLRNFIKLVRFARIPHDTNRLRASFFLAFGWCTNAISSFLANLYVSPPKEFPTECQWRLDLPSWLTYISLSTEEVSYSASMKFVSSSRTSSTINQKETPHYGLPAQVA